MKRTTTFLLLATICTTSALSQKVWLKVAENIVAMKTEQTQTESKPGWKIADIKMKDKKLQYLWGGRATQMTDDTRPTLIIYPDEKETLTDYAIIRLKRRKKYRQLVKTPIEKNEYSRFTPEHFNIVPATGLGFACTPRISLSLGEYVVVCLKQKPIGDSGDYVVYPFSVRER